MAPTSPVRPATPEELLARFQATGDPEALGGLFDATAPVLFRVALSLSWDAASAEDALQETYLVALEDAGRYDPRRPVMPWLLGILRRKVGRERWRQGRAVDPLRVEPRLAPVDPADEAERRELEGKVREALEGLQEPYRAVALMRWRYGLDPAEIAHIRGEPPGTVRSLLHRAMEKVRKALGGLPAFLFGPRVPRGIESVRREVVRSAGVRVAASAAAIGTAAAIGGAFVTKSGVAAVVALCVLAGGGWWLLGGRGTDRVPGPISSGPGLAGPPIPGPRASAPGEAARKPTPLPPPATIPWRKERIEVGIFRESGEPAAGERLLLVRGTTAGTAGPRAEARTDDRGRAIFETAPAGACLLLWCAPGGASLPIRGGLRVPEDSGIALTLPGFRPLDIEIGEADGTPLRGAKVKVAVHLAGTLVVEGVTSNEGKVRFPRFPWDSSALATLEVDRGGGPTYREDQFGSLLAAARATGRLRYLLRPRCAVRFAFDPPPPATAPLRVDLRWRTMAFTVERTYDLPAGTPVLRGLEPGEYLFQVGVADATVALRGEGEATLRQGQGEVVVPVRLAAERLCTVQFLRGGVPFHPASHKLRVGRSGEDDASSRPVGLLRGSPDSVALPPGPAWIAGTVEDRDGRTGLVDAEVPAEARALRIEVSETGAIRGAVTDPDGSSVLGAWVTATAVAATPRASSVDGLRAEVDEGGYRLEGLFPGEWRIRASRPAATTPDLQFAETFVLVRGGEEVVCDIALGKGRSIQGAVTDRRGVPVEGVRVDAVSAMVNGTRGQMQRDPNARGAVSDREGRFTLRDLGGGTWDLMATGPGIVPAILPDVPAGQSGVTLAVDRGAEITIRLRGTLPVDPQCLFVMLRRVTDAAGEVVDYHLPMVDQGIRPTADGTVVLPRLPEGGTAEVAVNPDALPPGLSFRSRRFALENCQTGTRELDLAPGGSTLDGRVLDEEGRPVAFARLGVRMEGIDAEPDIQVTADSEGRFRLAGVPEASGATVWGSADDCPPRKLEVRPLRAPLEVVLSRGIRARGEVLDGKGARVPMVMVSPVPEGITVWTDQEGRFDTLVPAGTRALIARSGLRVGRSALSAEGGPVRIVLGQGEAFLDVEVVDGDGAPLPGLRVTVEGDNAIGDTDARGRARLGPLVPGRYRLLVPGLPPTEGETGIPVRITLAK